MGKQLAFALVFAGLTFAGCSSVGTPIGDGAPDADVEADGDAEALAVCDDDDGDGYGAACDLGPDCDDSDPARGWVIDGCPCAAGDAPIDCRDTGETTDEHGLQCGLGTRECVDGAWGPCVVTSFYYPEDEAGDGTRREPIITESEACGDPTCDRGCLQQYACLSGIDLSPENSSNLSYDPFPPPFEHAGVVLGRVSADGSFRYLITSACAGPTLWWAITFDASVHGNGRVTFSARTGASAEALAAMGDDGFRLVAECTAAACPQPELPSDRLAGGGNLFDALGGAATATAPFLEVLIELSAGGDVESPRFTHDMVYHFCDAPL